MDSLAAELDAAVQRWDAEGLPRPDAMVVAGSGLSVDLGEPLAGPRPLAELAPFDVHGIAGHPLEWMLLELAGRRVLYYRGRLHAYQGFEPAEVVFPVRLGALLGARRLLLSNAAGCLRADAVPGELFLIRDHLNLTGLNPLRGQPPASWGPRFPDMTEAYDPRLRALVQRAGRRLDLELREGVYAGLLGPSFETPAEIEALRRLGADLVGMSTVLEVIAARHLAVGVLAVSLVTNLAAGVSGDTLGHEEVLAIGQRAGDRVRRLIGAVLADPEL